MRHILKPQLVAVRKHEWSGLLEVSWLEALDGLPGSDSLLSPLTYGATIFVQCSPKG